MALNNTLTQLKKVIGPVMQETLRGRGWIFDCSNTDFSLSAAQRGDTINATFAQSLTASAVVASPSGTDAPPVTPTAVSLVLNNWQEASFALTHKQMLEIMTDPAFGAESGQDSPATQFLKQQTAAAVEAIISNIENTAFIAAVSGAYGGSPLGFHTDTYAGTNCGVLSGSFAALTSVRANLVRNFAPFNDRFAILGPDAMSSLLTNPNLTKLLEAGTPETLREGHVGRAFGFQIIESNYVPYFYSGSVINGVNLPTQVQQSANIILQREGLGIAVRPANSGDNVIVFVDPLSGCPLTLSVWQQQYQTKFSVSALWGVVGVRTQFLNVLWG